MPIGIAGCALFQDLHQRRVGFERMDRSRETNAMPKKIAVLARIGANVENGTYLVSLEQSRKMLFERKILHFPFRDNGIAQSMENFAQ